MRKRLEEIYCQRIRDAGSHGTWEPPTRVWPGSTGEFRRGVFCRTGYLDQSLYGYTVVPGEEATELIETAAISSADAELKGAVADPLGYVISGNGSLSYQVSGGDEILVLTQPGRWHEIDDIQALLSTIQATIEDWPIGWAVVCQVYETSGAVIGVSSRSTTEFKVELNAKSVLSIGALVKAGTRAHRRAAHAARRAFSLAPQSGGNHGTGYTPLFNKGYRVRRDLWSLFGRPELVTFDGNRPSFRIATSDPTELLYDPGRATLTLEQIKELPLDKLFEETTPALISEEASIDTDVELYDEDIAIDLTPQVLIESGVSRLTSVSVPEHFAEVLLELRDTEGM
jgi:hypothetical protein